MVFHHWIVFSVVFNLVCLSSNGTICLQWHTTSAFDWLRLSAFNGKFSNRNPFRPKCDSFSYHLFTDVRQIKWFAGQNNSKRKSVLFAEWISTVPSMWGTTNRRLRINNRKAQTKGSITTDLPHFNRNSTKLISLITDSKSQYNIGESFGFVHVSAEPRARTI